jgi:hypothetical protein
VRRQLHGRCRCGEARPHAIVGRACVSRSVVAFPRVLRRRSRFAGPSGAIGILALLLAGVGLAAMLSYVVEQRTPEIGIRRALRTRDARSFGLLNRVPIAPSSFRSYRHEYG